MGVKYNTIIEMQRNGLNTHQNILCKNYNELTEAARKMGYNITIRGDSRVKISCAPFEIIKSKKDFDRRIDEVLTKFNGYEMLISNGILCDLDMIANIAIKMQRDTSFYAEFSCELIPFRNMYKNSKLLHRLYGELTDKSGIRLENRSIKTSYLTQVKEFINHFYVIADEYNIFNKNVELSLYNKNVGVRNKNTVYWEIY